jgi:hypothetical protein
VLVRTYRVFCLDVEGRITYAQPLDAADDAAAIKQAHGLPRDSVCCEVWDVDRLVGRFDGRNGGDIRRP